jgi:hypothetical protein
MGSFDVSVFVVEFVSRKAGHVEGRVVSFESFVFSLPLVSDNDSGYSNSIVLKSASINELSGKAHRSNLEPSTNFTPSKLHSENRVNWTVTTRPPKSKDRDFTIMARRQIGNSAMIESRLAGCRIEEHFDNTTSVKCYL